MRVILDDDHKYWDLDTGLNVPGVTEVLTRTGIVQYPDIPAMAKARHRGSATALAIELHENDRLVEESLTKNVDLAELNVQAYFDAYRRFKDDWIAQIVAVEKIVWHELYWYAGKLDQLSITMDGRLVVWDWKTGPIPWWIELQTGSYLEALLTMEEFKSQEIWHGAVSLRADGTYGTPRLSLDRSAFAMFRQALNVVHYTRKKGKR